MIRWLHACTMACARDDASTTGTGRRDGTPPLLGRLGGLSNAYSTIRSPSSPHLGRPSLFMHIMGFADAFLIMFMHMHIYVYVRGDM